MLGDVAVAVNPADERYRDLVGQHVVLPLTGREIPVIADDYVDREFGTGCVKITPAHDFNDWQVGQRHGLPAITVLTLQATINENGPEAYRGLDRYEARERVVHDLQEQGFLVGTKDYTVPLGKCDRCKTIVEPRLSTQWFVAVNKEPKSGGGSMAQLAREVVERGYIKFTPENYKTIYLNWMENIHDWCISRQLWWGHRIPAWHCAGCREITVSREEPKQCSMCGSTEIEQDTDVLDTWFSSGLLPASPFGWPDQTADARAFYPTTLLITGFDILFFWVARMIMMNTFFMRDFAEKDRHPDQSRADRGGTGGPAFRTADSLACAVPFQNVYIHGLVRDADRQKMSKTKGNVLDPIEVIKQYGTDATRFTLASMASPGTDIAFNEQRVEGYRAFANKIWNAARFMFMNVDKLAEAGIAITPPQLCHPERSEGPLSSAKGLNSFTAATLEDRWILSRFNRVAQELDESLKAYRFDEAANRVYSFFWGEFCDWYVELIKPRMFDLENAAGKDAAKIACQNTVVVFEAALRLLSPIMPFITEEIWHAVYDDKVPMDSIALAPFPQADPALMDADSETEMAILQDLIVATRNIRAELKVEPKVKVPVEIHASSPQVREMIEHNRGALERLANVETVTFVEAAPQQSSNVRSTTRFDVRVIYEQKIDKAAECERLKKDVEKFERERSNAERQLGNQNFLAKAPAHVVEGLRKRAGELDVLLEKAKSALAQLEA
jgi:valyl-tRNA synthetase